MTFVDMAGLILAMASTFVGAPAALAREWLFDAEGVTLHTPVGIRSPEYESFLAGGVRSVFENSPMRYDVAIYGGSS